MAHGAVPGPLGWLDARRNGCRGLRPGFSGAHRGVVEAVSIVNDTIEGGIGEGRIADQLAPCVRRSSRSTFVNERKRHGKRHHRAATPAQRTGTARARLGGSRPTRGPLDIDDAAYPDDLIDSDETSDERVLAHRARRHRVVGVEVRCRWSPGPASWSRLMAQLGAPFEAPGWAFNPQRLFEVLVVVGAGVRSPDDLGPRRTTPQWAAYRPC
jgi:hypothetical protein